MRQVPRSRAQATPASEETASTGPVSGSTTELDASNPIKIGYLAWASGADAYFGLVAIAALEDRIEEINANGGLLGRKVELVWYDISADFSESVNATNKLINQDHVDAIIVRMAALCHYARRLVEEAQVPLLPNCGNAEVTVDTDGRTKALCFPCRPAERPFVQYDGALCV